MSGNAMENGAPSRSPGGSPESRAVGGPAACGRTDGGPTILTRVIASGINVLGGRNLDGWGVMRFACRLEHQS